MDNLIGKRLDGLYEVQELIGSGGMANVYKAVMRGQNGPVPAGTVVAVKVLRQEYMHDPDLVRRFKNESKAISLLNHPNIVKVYDVSVNDHLQYIVMEYVDGMTLREYLNERGGKLSSRETVHFISQILKALEHAHANGIVHRDIKPQNIMLLDNGQLRMMDFGIARISRADNQMLAGSNVFTGKAIHLKNFINIVLIIVIMIFICIFRSICPEGVAPAYGNTLIIFIINSFIAVLRLRLHSQQHHGTGDDKYECQGKGQNVLTELSSSLHAVPADSSLTSSFVQCVHTEFLFSLLFG